MRHLGSVANKPGARSSLLVGWPKSIITGGRVEQDHRFIKRRVNPGLGFFSFKTARRTISGFEAMNIIRKGQIEGVGKGAIQGQVRFVSNLFMIAA